MYSFAKFLADHIFLQNRDRKYIKRKLFASLLHLNSEKPGPRIGEDRELYHNTDRCITSIR
jgi:hypothetical protein